MKPNEIHLTDWVRILVGNVPASFYIELFIRALVIYFLLMLSMRLMGKRMSSQLGRNELAALVSLAAAIGVPLQAPDRGLLPAFIIAMIVILTERWISAKAFKNQKFEKFSQGNIAVLVKDSVLDVEMLRRVRLTRERLIAQLRSSGIKQLGMVKRFYMEANGSFSIIQEKEPRPGLSVLPAWDEEFNARFKKSKNIMTCNNCGNTQKMPFDTNSKCTNCGDKFWIPAVE